MADLAQYKCPCCSGAIEFNSKVQKMKCPYCDTEFEMETLKSFDEELSGESVDNMEWTSNDKNTWSENEQSGMKVYICQSCGGEIIGDENTAATNCPYCDNPVVFKSQFKGDLRPDYVIPFKLDKEAAKAALRKHYEGKKLLPNVFKDENHLEEIKGVYVPFWLFDAKADANIKYNGERFRAWSDSKYNYTETSHFLITREGTLDFAHVPVDGSTQMDDAMMESIEPFDFKDAVDFQTAYLAGYLSDKYDVNADESKEHANRRIKQSTEDAFMDTVNGFSAVTPRESAINLSEGRVKYAMYPVWLLNTRWKGNKYTFAMNGQTGKLVGDLPVDKAKFRKFFLRYFLIFGAISSVIMCLFF